MCLVIVMAGVTTLVPSDASAQQAQPRPQAAAPAKPSVARVRDLITPQERQAYRLIVRDSIEEKILDHHRAKRDLASDLLDGSEISARLTDDNLLDLIRM